MKISISDSAFNDLEAIKSYYNDEGVPHVGDEFVIEIISHIEICLDYSFNDFIVRSNSVSDRIHEINHNCCTSTSTAKNLTGSSQCHF